ncbi:protein DpdE [Spirillospora sp. CA-294931]|uniref:protein DpdE n=1 Tax=Spirillospora sp. CA-294931 TaxID=3240042 RepID=UPI003D8F940F
MPDRFTVGQLVQYAGSPGVGRIGTIEGRHAQVEFFESVAAPVAHSEQVALVDCQAVVLAAETRVYWKNPDTGDWLAGRVTAMVDDRCFVRFPNAAYDRPVPTNELRVRWDRPIADPVTVLTAGGNESAYFHAARMPFLRDLVAQRAASANISALSSSAVEFFSHQVHAALTVLSDPVQRYLLADEVGLGKSVQAGFVIRQTLLDHPEASVCVVVPEVLRRQWARELHERFFIGDFPSATVKVVAHETSERWVAYHKSDLVVVDEAHRLVQASGPEDPSYRALTDLVHSSPRLLLLSATPVMSHHTTQLGLLHLLDPELYRWTDSEAFERKYRLRAQLAREVHALDSDFTYLLPSAIEDIGALLPASDRRFAELSVKVLELLDEDDELRPDADPAELKIRTGALRAHISEAYRLHRRVIRHRRHTVAHEDPGPQFPLFEVRGRQEPQTLVLDDAGHAAGGDALSRWRSQVWDALLNAGMECQAPAYAMVLAVLVSRAGVSPEDLAAALAWRIEGDQRAADWAGLDARERALLREPTVLEADRAALAGLRTLPGGFRLGKRHLDDLIDTMLPAIKSRRRAVIFCGPGRLAGALTERMRQRFGKLAVYEHSRRVDADAAEKAISAWSVPPSKHPGSTVLVADDSAEDGLNLQAADAAVHVRLPWSANQLEQRLGRVDRYQAPGSGGPAGPAHQYLIGDLDAEDSFLQAWAVLLTDGFKIFTESVSTLQDAISEGLVEVWTAALEQGPEGLLAMTAPVQTNLGAARDEIDKLDMLEAVHETAEEARELTEALLEVEAAWREMRTAMFGYVANKGGIKLRHHDRTVAGCEREVFDLWQSHPLLDPRRWFDARSRVSQEMAQGAFNRSAAFRAPGTRLLRPGNPLVDILAAAVYHDDRGQASAFRRIDPTHDGPAIAFFGFDYLIEADLSGALSLVADQAGASLALRRQADQLLPPFTLRTWIETGTQSPVTSASVTGWLERPYDNRRDHNYNAERMSHLLEVFGGWAGYRTAAVDAEHLARAHLADVTDLARRCARAQDRSRQRVAVTLAQAQARQAAGHLVGDTESLLTDAAVTDALVEGLSQPAVKVIAATCIIRTGREVVRRVGQ